MSPAPLFLALLIITTPSILIFDGPIIHGVVVAAAALLVAIVGLRIRPGEARFLSSVTRSIALVAAFPALWMLIQVLPLASIGLAHPIWESAAAALGRSLAGSISIDPGETLVSLARYLSVAAIALVAAAVSVDRNFAKWILFALTTATALIALIVLAAGIGSFAFLNIRDGGPTAVAATDSAGLGIILAFAAALQVLERGYLKTDQNRFPLAFVACFVAIAICCLATFISGTWQTYFAVACGVTTLAVAIVIRRFRPGPWGYSAIMSIAVIVAVSVIALRPGDRTMDLTVAFADRAPAPLMAVTQRILAETRWMGTGAGTFGDVLPIYRDIDELRAGPAAPTAAAAVAVEMGRPFLWATLIAAIAFVAILLRGSVRRGRDSSYAMAGAGCTVAITLLAFGNAGVFSTPVLLIAAAAAGTAIAQSKSRSI